MAKGPANPGPPADIDEGAAIRLLRAADAMLPKLKQVIEQSDLFPPPWSYRGRVKKEAALFEKIVRKRSQQIDSKFNYKLSDVGDIIGLRFVTLLRLDIAEVCDNLFQLIRSGGLTVVSGAAGKARVVEFKQYISNPPPAIDPETGAWLDPLTDQLRETYERHGYDPADFKVEIKAKYSSIHISLRVDFNYDSHACVVPVEIQVRSVFEDAWGEIDHKMFYKADQQGALVGDAQRLAAKRHLDILKNMLDNAAEYAALIHELDLGKSQGRAPDVKTNLDGSGYLQNLCAPLRDHRELLGEFMALMGRKDDLDAKLDPKGRSGAKKGGDVGGDVNGEKDRLLGMYVGLAEQFSELLNRFRALKLDAEALAGLADKKTADHARRMRTVIYLVGMEEALCRFLNGQESQIERAAANYLALTVEYPEYPGCWFRLAQTRAELIEQTSDIEVQQEFKGLAVEAYGRARQALDRLDDPGNVFISPGQKVYIDDNLERLQGFVLWRASDLRRRQGRKVDIRDYEDVFTAWTIASQRHASHPAIDRDARLETLNSATFFAIDALAMASKLSGVNQLPSLSDLRAWTDELGREAEAHDTVSIRVWHTLLKGYEALRDEARRIRMARQVTRVHAAASLMHESDYERECHERAFRDAWSVLENMLDTPGDADGLAARPGGVGEHGRDGDGRAP